jgi:DNA modification methylase
MATKPSAVIDTRVIYCGDNLDQLRKFPAQCVDLIYIDPPFNSNRNYEVFWGETKEPTLTATTRWMLIMKPASRSHMRPVLIRKEVT